MHVEHCHTSDFTHYFYLATASAVSYRGTFKGSNGNFLLLPQSEMGLRYQI